MPFRTFSKVGGDELPDAGWRCWKSGRENILGHLTEINNQLVGREKMNNYAAFTTTPESERVNLDVGCIWKKIQVS